jgi:type IV secretory pathway VirB3-like protein
MEMPMTRRNREVSRPNRLAAREASTFSKQSLAHAFRVMAPSLIVLTLATAAHAQGTMDFSGATTLMGTFKPLPINQAMNRPRAKLGLDLSAWMAIVFVCVTVFLVGFRMLAILSFPTLAGGAWLIVRKHPKMFQLWGLSLSQKSYYDPRKY